MSRWDSPQRVANLPRDRRRAAAVKARRARARRRLRDGLLEAVLLVVGSLGIFLALLLCGEWATVWEEVWRR